MEDAKKFYIESWANFISYFKDAIELSHKSTNIAAPTSRHFYASVLFTRLVICSASLKKLCPHPSQLGKDAIWDCLSACAITRNILECYLIFYYFCIDNIGEIEWDARWRLFNLHDFIQRRKMFDSYMSEDDTEATNKLVNELASNGYFETLSEKQKRHYLKGNNALFKPLDKIAESRGDDVTQFRMLYRFLSNQIHSLPMSFYRTLEHERGRGMESEVEVGYSAICLDTAYQNLREACSEYTELFNMPKQR